MKIRNLPDSVKAVPILAVGGVGFALGNLFLAEALSSSDFGHIVLYLVFVQLSQAVAPLGAETLVIRRLLLASKILLARVAASSFIVSVLLALIAYKFYHLPAILSFLLFGNCLLAGMTRVGAAVFQANHQVLISISVLQFQNLFILIIGAVALLSNSIGMAVVCLCINFGYALTTIYSWRPSILSRDTNKLEGSWKEGLALVGLSLALILLMQLERLIIPQALNLSDLALFAVCAAIYLAPFRMYQMAVIFILPAKIRREESPALRKNIVYGELFRSTIICVLISGVIWLLGPLIIAIFGLENYELNQNLIAAALLSGTVKVLSTIGTVTITATGTKLDIRRMNQASWLILFTSLPLAVYCSQWGITGIILSVTLSWTMYGAVGLFLQLKNIKCSLASY